MKIAICDDEKEIRDSIERNIRLLYADAEILSFKGGKSLLAYTGKLDILFLDIRMEQIDGMEVARKLRETGNNVTVIFVTAVEEYVFQAFDVGAFHYLLKPIEPSKFFEVLHKAVENRRSNQADNAKEEACIAIKKGGMTQKVFLREIFYLEIFNRKIIMHTAKENIEFYGKLAELENSLGNEFMRCHRSFIVNLRYVLKYDARSIILEDGTEILLSKKKYPDFVKKYMQYLKGMAEKAQNLC